MPRLTSEEFFTRRVRLGTDWQEGGRALRLLSNEQQWALHDFYLLAHDLLRSEILMRREKASRADPTLVKNAGLAYRSFTALAPADATESAIREVKTAVSRRRGRRSGRIVIRTDAHPSTDLRLLAEALILHTQQTTERNQTGIHDSDR